MGSWQGNPSVLYVFRQFIRLNITRQPTGFPFTDCMMVYVPGGSRTSGTTTVVPAFALIVRFRTTRPAIV